MTSAFEKIPPYTLFSFRRCPYAMRARMALRYAGVPHIIHEVSLKDKPPEMLALSPKGSVPVFVLPEYKIVDESLDIMFYALKQSDKDGWLDVDLEKAKALIAENDGPFKHALDRYKYPNRYPDEDCSDARGKVESFFKSLNEHLDKNKFLLGHKMSIADIAIFPFIRQAAHTDKEWFEDLNYTRLKGWLDFFKSSPLFVDIMDKNYAGLCP